MIGKPKYKREDNVTFIFNGVEKSGVIYIVDSYGTFEQNEEPSYDIYSPLENCLFKHVRESEVLGEIKEI